MPEGELRWIKSTRSIGEGACVEMAADQNSILIRHSRHPDVQIRYSRAEIVAFFDGVRGHEFDALVKGD